MRARVESAHNKFRSRRNLLLALSAVALACLLMVSAGSAVLPPSHFEGNDGNLTVDTSGNSDWASLTPAISCSAPVVGCLVDTPSGSTDNSFTGGSSEDDPNVNIAQGSIPNNKDDLLRSYLATETTGGSTFLYLAWVRAQTNGDAHIDFELNQNPTPGWDASTTGALTINRTAGDVLLTYDFSGSGTPTIGLLTWITSGTCAASSGKLPCWGNPQNLSAAGDAEAAVNNVIVPDPIFGGSIPVNQFGETSINLSAIPGFFQPGVCKDFGSVFLKSRSSGSGFDSELKDFIAPASIFLSNCGSIELTKTWAGGGPASTTTLTIGKTVGGGEVAPGTVVTNPNPGTTGAFVEPPATYYLNETPVTNFTPSPLSCVNNANGGSTVTIGASNGVSVGTHDEIVCTFTNTYVKAGPTISTSATVSAPIGSPINDVATLTGARGTPDKSTVTFNVYAASDSTCATPLNASPIAATSSSAGPPPTYTSAGYTPAAAGNYKWIATFAGDGDNNAVVGTCGALGRELGHHRKAADDLDEWDRVGDGRVGDQRLGDAREHGK